MGRGFDECGSRGAMLISLSDDDCSAEFLELSDRRYEKIEVCVTGRDAYEALYEAVFAADKENIYRFELTGECESAPKQSHLAALAEKRGLYAAFLKDSTLPPAHTGGVSLKNTLLKAAEERIMLPDADRDEINAALKWALAALEGAEAPEEVAR